MTTFGGLGGVRGGRPRDPYDRFEQAIDACFGEQLRADGPPRSCLPFDGTTIGCRIWGSLANVDWVHESGDTASYSFRAAGDMIAAIVGSGDYMDWYCSYPYGEADQEVAYRLREHGWTPVEDDEQGVEQ